MAVGSRGQQVKRSLVEWQALMIEADPDLRFLYSGWFRGHPPYWPPDGTSPEAYGAHLLDKFERWLADPAAAPRPTRSPYRKPPTLRASRFDAVGALDAQAVANEATTLVLRHHRDAVEHWLAHPKDGWDRLQLHADLAGSMGPMGTLAVRAPDAAEPELLRGVTGCTVVVRRRVWSRGGRGNLVVVDSYPEPPLDRAWRERYPDLVHAIGGYLHQTNLDHGAFLPQRQFHLDTVGPARERVREQLAGLLAGTDDQQLDEALRAFGSALVPYPHPVPREWLTRWHWRIDGLPWNRRAANGWADRGGLPLK